MRAGVTNLVEVEDLHVHFGAARAVDGASLHVSPGEVLALVGESGSGKTTLIRAIQGLQKPTSGQIRVEREDGDRSRPKVQTIFNPTVQMVFQDPTGALNPRQTIYEVVAEGLAHPAWCRQRTGPGGAGTGPGRPSPTGAILPPVSA